MNKINKKHLLKIFLPLTIIATSIPLITVVACGNSSSENNVQNITLNTSNSYLFNSPTKLIVQNIDDDEKINSAISIDTNALSVKEIIQILKDQKDKFTLTINFQDSKVAVDVQIKWVNNIPNFIINKVYIEKGGLNVTNDLGRFKINIFKAFVRKYLTSIFEKQADINSSTNDNSIIQIMRNHYSTIRHDDSDPKYFYAPSNNNSTINIIVFSHGININEFVNDIVEAAKKSINTITAIKIDSRIAPIAITITINGLVSPATDFKDEAQVKSLIENQKNNDTNLATIFSNGN